MQSSNPAMRVISAQAGQLNFGGTDAVATVSGTTTKSLILVALTFVVGFFSLYYGIGLIITGAFGTLKTLTWLSVIVAFVVALITIFKPQFAPITAPIYAVFEGVGLGLISAMYELKFAGIVSTAVISTFAVVITMLALWKFKIIVPTQKFKAIVTGATLAVAALYLLNIITSLFSFPIIPQAGALSIVVSIVICAIAALNLILDFDNIQNAVDLGLPKYFEYFNAFSLLVTICWLYLEILRLLSKRGE